ncbi:MAG: MFS transporter [Actinomycetales bacterium]
MAASTDKVHPASPQPPESDVRRVALSSYLGNTIEYYDFILYGASAAVIFGPLFFSNLSPAMATMASFATFGAGYIARPLGGIFFGAMGDRVGRKSALLSTMLIMGLASGSMGLLPTYEQIGVGAPVALLILRIIQGIAVGGEWGGAALMAAEHAPAKSRGFYTAIAQSGLSSGGLLSTIAITLVTLLPDEQLFSWGWRIPFLLSFLLLAVGLYTRMKISESPLFKALQEDEHERASKKASLAGHSGELLRGMALTVPPVMASTVFGSFAIAYAVEAGHARPTVLAALSLAWAVAIVATVVYGRLSDAIGRRPIFVGAAISMALLVYPLFLAIGSDSTVLMFAAFSIAFAVITVAMSGVMAAILSEMFPTEIRYTGISIAYQGGTVIAGVAPLASSALLATGGGQNIFAVAIMVAFFAVMAALAVLTAKESRGRDLSEERQAQAEQPLV